MSFSALQPNSPGGPLSPADPRCDGRAPISGFLGGWVLLATPKGEPRLLTPGGMVLPVHRGRAPDSTWPGLLHEWSEAQASPRSREKVKRPQQALVIAAGEAERRWKSRWELRMIRDACWHLSEQAFPLTGPERGYLWLRLPRLGCLRCDPKGWIEYGQEYGDD